MLNSPSFPLRAAWHFLCPCRPSLGYPGPGWVECGEARRDLLQGQGALVYPRPSMALGDLRTAVSRPPAPWWPLVPGASPACLGPGLCRQHWLFSPWLVSIPAARETVWGLGVPSLGSVPDGYVIRFGLAGPQAAGVLGTSETVAEADVTPPSPRENCWGAVLPSVGTAPPPGCRAGTLGAAGPPSWQWARLGEWAHLGKGSFSDSAPVSSACLPQALWGSGGGV